MKSEIFQGFDWENGTFDAVQEAYLKQYSQSQIELYLTGETNEKLATKHLNRVYKQLGKSKPKVVFYDSPKAMIDSVGDSVRDSVWASVWASVRDSVWASVRASVWASVRASVWASVRASVWASVRDSVWASVWASVGDSVRDSVRSWEWSGSMSFYKFFSDNFEKNALEDWCLYSEQVCGGVLTDEIAHVVKKPIRIVRNAAGLLDYDHDKAIEWADGYGFYYLGGVEFKKTLWKKIVDEKLELKDLGKITNADQRAAAVQYLRADRLLEQVKAKLIHTGKRGIELYKVPNFMDTGDTEYCMKLEHPTIKGKFYIEWVEPKLGKAGDVDICMAQSRGITVRQYLTAEIA